MPATFSPPHEWSSNQIQLAIKQLRWEPIPSLQYLRDVLLHTIDAQDADIDPSEKPPQQWPYPFGVEFGMDPAALASAIEGESELQTAVDTIVLGGGEMFLDDLIYLYDLPIIDLEDEYAHDSLPHFVANLMWLLLQLSPDFKQMVLTEARIRSLVDVLYSDATLEGIRRTTTAVIMSPLRNENECRAALKRRFSEPDPWRSVIVMEALLRARFRLVDLFDIGGCECVVKCLRILPGAPTHSIKALGILIKDAFKTMRPKPRGRVNGVTQAAKHSANYLRTVMDKHLLTPDNISALVFGWLAQTELVPSAALSELVAEVICHQMATHLQVLSVILNRLDDLDLETPEGESVVIGISTFLGQQSISFEAKKILFKQSRIVDMLVTMLSTTRARSTAPFVPENLVAHAVAMLIPLDRSIGLLREELLNPKERFMAVLQNITRISEFDPFAAVRSAVGDGPMGGALLLNMILDHWKDMRTVVFDEFFPRMFDPERNENPEYGCAVLMRHLTHNTVVEGFIRDGAVPFCFHVAQNTIPGEQQWENAIQMLTHLANFDAGTVDLLAVSSAVDIVRNALACTIRARTAAAKLLTATMRRMEESDLLDLRDVGIVQSLMEALQTSMVDVQAETALVVALVVALKVMVSRSAEIRDDVAAEDGVVARLVTLLFAHEPRRLGCPPDTSIGGPFDILSTESAALLAEFHQRGADRIVAGIKRKIAATKSFADRASLLAPIHRALSVETNNQYLHEAVIAAGVIALIFGVVSEPSFLAANQEDLRKCAASLLTRDIAGEIWKAYAYQPMLEVSPGIVNIFIAWAKGDDENLATAGMSGLLDILGWDMTGIWVRNADGEVRKTPKTDLRIALLEPSAGITHLIIDELSKRGVSRMSPATDFSEATEREEQEHAKMRALEMLDKLLADQVTFCTAKTSFTNAGAMDVLKALQRTKDTRALANKILRRLERDTPLDDGAEEDHDFDAECFEALGDVLVDPEADPYEKAMALHEMPPLAKWPQAQDTLFGNPAVVQSLVGALFMAQDEAFVAPEAVADLQQGMSLEGAEDMAHSARDTLETIDFTNAQDPLVEKVVGAIRERLSSKDRCRDGEHFAQLSAVHFAARDSHGNICQLFVSAGLPDLVVDVLSDESVTTASIRLAVEVIEDFAASDHVEGIGRLFLNAGIVPALAAVVKAASSETLNGFRRLSPFGALTSLVSHTVIEVSDLDATLGVCDLVRLALAELHRNVTRQDYDEDLPDEEREWGNLLALALARIMPLNFLDRLLALPETFAQVRKVLEDADAKATLELIREDGREPGPYDFGNQEDMRVLAKEILERIERDELDAPIPCRCWRCHQKEARLESAVTSPI